MTLRQIAKVLLWPRDDEGKMIPSDPVESSGPTYKEAFFGKFRMWKFPEWQIEEKWQKLASQRSPDNGGW